MRNIDVFENPGCLDCGRELTVHTGGEDPVWFASGLMLKIAVIVRSCTCGYEERGYEGPDLSRLLDMVPREGLFRIGHRPFPRPDGWPDSADD